MKDNQPSQPYDLVFLNPNESADGILFSEYTTSALPQPSPNQSTHLGPTVEGNL